MGCCESSAERELSETDSFDEESSVGSIDSNAERELFEAFNEEKELLKSAEQLCARQKAKYSAFCELNIGGEVLEKGVADEIMEYMNAIWGVGEVVLIQYCNQGGAYLRISRIVGRFSDKSDSIVTFGGRGTDHLSVNGEFVFQAPELRIDYNRCWKTDSTALPSVRTERETKQICARSGHLLYSRSAIKPY